MWMNTFQFRSSGCVACQNSSRFKVSPALALRQPANSFRRRQTGKSFVAINTAVVH
jgi:hypothetical protein